MSDFSRTRELFEHLGFPFGIAIQPEGKELWIGGMEGDRESYTHVDGDETKAEGYLGFVTIWSFDADGGFIKVGIWE